MLCFANGTGEVSVSCVVGCYALPILCFVGLSLNLFSIAVFTSDICRSRRERSGRSRLVGFLVFLCVLDSLKLVFSLLIISPSSAVLHMTQTGQDDHRTLNFIAVYSVRIFYPFLVATNYACIWTITAICIHRYFGICYPLSSRGFRALQHNRIVIGLICGVAIAINLVRYWELEVSRDERGEPTLKPGVFHRSESRLYLILTDGVVYVALLYAIPLLLLAAMNSRIILTIYRAKAQAHLLCASASVKAPVAKKASADEAVAWVGSGGAIPRNRLASTRTQSREFRSAYMIMAIVGLFFCCYTLPVVIRIREILDPNFGNSHAGALMYELSNLLVNLNSALDPLFYFMFTQGFKDILSNFRKRSASRRSYERVSLHVGGGGGGGGGRERQPTVSSNAEEPKPVPSASE